MLVGLLSPSPFSMSRVYLPPIGVQPVKSTWIHPEKVRFVPQQKKRDDERGNEPPKKPSDRPR